MIARAPMAASWTRDLGIGLVAGAFSGLFGVGGGIVAVPLLVLLAHFAQKSAQATSLVMITIGAAAGAIVYELDGAVAWAPAAFILIGGILGTLAGTTLIHRVTDRRLQLAFAGLLVLAAIRMLWAAAGPEATALPAMTAWISLAYVLCGVAMGVLSAMMGVGGGIILIPLLVAFFGFSQHDAAGTSLIVMVPIALLGAVRLSRSGLTKWPSGLRLGLGSAIGALAGASLALAANQGILRALFGALLILVAAQMMRAALRSGAREQSSLE